MPFSANTRFDLFPAIEPRTRGMLALDATHSMYWEESGNPQGIPVVFLHGGPGAGSSADHRRFFDPECYRIIVYDQRGAGRSTPLAEITNNTTQLLIDDLERLRASLSIDRWQVFGGSWGSTLALAYAEAHPQRCAGLVLRGIFLGHPGEIDWFLYELRRFFPEAWRTFASHIPEAERADLLGAYHSRLIDPNPAIHLPAARIWSAYEGACSMLRPNVDTIRHFGGGHSALALARIEAHYFVNRVFLEENALLRDLDRIRHLPCVIVQGRYDAICPIMTADTLARAWPEARYVIVPDAGHSAWEPGILSALVEATETFKSTVTA